MKTKQKGECDILGTLAILCIVAAIVMCIANSARKQSGIKAGDYVKITKTMDNGHGKIGIVQEVDSLSGYLSRKHAVKYVKEVKTNVEKTEFTPVYSDIEYYEPKYLKLIRRNHVVKENGQFKEK